MTWNLPINMLVHWCSEESQYDIKMKERHIVSRDRSTFVGLVDGKQVEAPPPPPPPSPHPSNFIPSQGGSSVLVLCWFQMWCVIMFCYSN